MFRWLDHATNFLLRFAYDSMKVFLIFVMLARAFNKKFDITGLFGYTAIILLLSVAVNYFLSTLDDQKRAKFRYMGIFGILLSLMIGVRFNSDYEFTGQMIMGGYFVVVWMNGIKFITEKDNTHYFFRRFFQTFLLMVFISISIGIGQLRWYLAELQPFYTVFFLSVIMNLISMNLKAAYQEASANIMQKSKRVLAFNIVSIFVLSLSILGLTVLFSNISLGWMEDVLRFALMPILQLGTWFSNRIRARAIKRMQDNDDVSSGGAESVDEMRESMADDLPLHTESPWDQYIEWFVIVVVILALIGLAYYLTRRIEQRRVHKEEDDNSEIRESLLTGEYIKKHFAKRMGEFADRLNRVLGRNTTELPIIRRIYRDYLHYIVRKGVPVTEDMTPNEILERDRLKRGIKEKPEWLTEIYNRHRYGGVPEETFDADLLEQISQSIDSKEL